MSAEVHDRGLQLAICEPYIYHELVVHLDAIPRPVTKVLDLGANAGVAGLYCAHKWGSEVVAVEPFDPARLVSNFTRNNLEGKLTLLQLAVWSHPGERLAMHRTGNDGMVGAVYEDVTQRTLCSYRPHTITPAQLATIAGPCDLVKIDIEGAEHVLDLGALYENAQFVILEQHTGGTNPTIDLERGLSSFTRVTEQLWARK